MTPKEKADELVLNFFRIQDDVINHETTWHEAKQCALIAVDEIIEEVRGGGVVGRSLYWKGRSLYWKEVKQEIEKL